MLTHFDPTRAGGQEANPTSTIYGGPMVDPSRIHVWCWDARPFPAFPTQSAAWSDGPNWATGHWLNGRLEGVPVDRLIMALAEAVDTSPLICERPAIGGFVDGYVLDRPMSPREAIEPLATLYGFDAVVGGGRLAFVDRRRKPVHTLSDGAWEIFSFSRAELVDRGTYRLSRLLRGLGGEEALATRVAPAGSTVVLLDDALTPLASDLTDLDAPITYAIGPADRDHADPLYVRATASATSKSLRPYTPTLGTRFVDVILFGGGGGGGSGACQAAGAAASGGGAGGGGGVARGLFPASLVGASQNITIAAGGPGGAAQTTNSTAGLAGGAGGDTSFGNLLKAFGAGGGAGGGLAVASGGGGGASGLTKGYSSSGPSAGPGSLSLGNGGSGVAGTLAQAPGFGGGGGGAPATGGAGADGGGSCSAASGGGAGGGISNANLTSNGGRGGVFFPGGVDTRGAMGLLGNGVISGGAGPGGFASAAGSLTQAGGGGGGGASGISLSGGGGPGGFPGGGGGGGGAHQNGGTGGAGGPGGAGYAVIIEHF